MKRILIVFAFVLGCVQPRPIPTPIPTPDAGGVDLFTSQIYDCSGLDTTPWKPYARTCGDAANTGSCMVNYVSATVPANGLACAARDVQVAAFLLIAQGIATEDDKARAAALRFWIKVENLTFRGSP
jgi:hypothetical protein